MKDLLQLQNVYSYSIQLWEVISVGIYSWQLPFVNEIVTEIIDYVMVKKVKSISLVIHWTFVIKFFNFFFICKFKLS